MTIRQCEFFRSKGPGRAVHPEHFDLLQRLNPSVVTFRVHTHNWGGNASEIVFYAEYEEFADIDVRPALRGLPRGTLQAGRGEEGYEELREAQRLFQEYYGEHRDEIYSRWRRLRRKVKNLGTVGPPEEEEGEEN